MRSRNICETDQWYRFDILNYLIKKYNYQSYLEIGVNTGVNISRINLDYKISVDPGIENKNLYKDISYKLTSDEFFKINTETFDLIFIDGLHESSQVIKDIDNSLKILNSRGTIMMHDCFPNSEAAQIPHRVCAQWNGDVWKAFAYYRKRSDLTMITCITDEGLGIIKKGNQEPYELPSNLNWKYFCKNAKKLMNMQSVPKTLELIDSLYENGL